MIRTHRAELRKVRVETASLCDDHRRTLREERQAVLGELREHSRTLRRERRGGQQRRSPPHGTRVQRDGHKQVLAEAKRIAKEDLEAHKRALAANPWLMLMVKMYEQTREQGAERERRRTEKQAARRKRATALRAAGSEA